VVECRERIERALDCLESDLTASAALTVQLHVALAVALLYTMGSVERIKMVLAKALSAAERMGDVDAMPEILFALCLVHHHSSECREAQTTAERFERLALRDPTLAPIAYRLTGNTLHYGGKQREAEHKGHRVFPVAQRGRLSDHAAGSRPAAVPSRSLNRARTSKSGLSGLPAKCPSA
jgi:hypothetical protein